MEQKKRLLASYFLCQHIPHFWQKAVIIEIVFDENWFPSYVAIGNRSFIFKTGFKSYFWNQNWYFGRSGINTWKTKLIRLWNADHLGCNIDGCKALCPRENITPYCRKNKAIYEINISRCSFIDFVLGVFHWFVAGKGWFLVLSIQLQKWFRGKQLVVTDVSFILVKARAWRVKKALLSWSFKLLPMEENFSNSSKKR